MRSRVFGNETGMQADVKNLVMSDDRSPPTTRDL
ncbi:hypothetical protein EYZ11_011794 [Aspergillus tanneri]|uniref:Uncharacterized protein n=1 Tax=Aspergillus tanneri TaxID=1220188 RepID=A0A4S3J1V7_9EURO|nr:hypothetical protein EYZ11_011794 [Aspergillus tanneri]